MISGTDLTEEQKTAVKTWAEEGCSLGEIQDRLGKDFELKLTYMNMHLLMLDLDISLEEEEEPALPEPAAPPPAAPADPMSGPAGEVSGMPPPASPLPGEPAGESVPFPEPGAAAGGDPMGGDAAAVPGGDVSVTIDDLMRPGAVASGTVTFAGGEQAIWMMDQMGRLGLDPHDEAFQPTQDDIAAFQVELQRLARQRGF